MKSLTRPSLVLTAFICLPLYSLFHVHLFNKYFQFLCGLLISKGLNSCCGFIYTAVLTSIRGDHLIFTTQA